MKLDLKNQLKEAGAVTLLIGSTSLAIYSAYELLAGSAVINNIGIVALLAAGALSGQLVSIALRTHHFKKAK